MNYNKFIDHTLLKPEATKEDIIKLCNEAMEYDFASVCINPRYVSLCASLLKDSDVNVCTVIGFPLGATSEASKVAEAKEALLDGADEIDMVISIGDLKDGNDDAVYEEIKALKEVCHDKVLKVILETCLLTNEEKVRACLLAVKAKADFVKTSTGFSKGGATVSDVRLMKQTVGDKAQVKASGGIRDKETFLAMIEAGATRIGASAGVKIMEDLKK